jgi:hypothetical protein
MTSDSKKEEKRRESPAGYHFYLSYLQNPRNWYYKYVLGLKPRYTGAALIKGGAMHEALAKYHLTGNMERAKETYVSELDLRRGEYQDPYQVEVDIVTGVAGLDVWYRTWAEQDEKFHEILEVEQGYEFRIGPKGAFRFTIRPDRVIRNKQTGKVYVPDVKTTGWSIPKTFETVEREKQITSYIWGLRQAHPEWEVDAGFADVIYVRWNKNSNKVSVSGADRSELIYRTNYELIEFEMNLVGIIVEITQKLRALKDIPYPLLFPDNPSEKFPSPYDVLGNRYIRPDEIPPGFERDEWHEVKALPDQVDLDEWIHYARVKGDLNV